LQDGIQIFTKGNELIGWMKNYDVIRNMGETEADLLLAYIHKKGLEICADGGSKLLLYKSESRQPELMCDMDELIDIVEEWNFEQMKVCEGKIIAEDDTDKKAGYRREKDLQGNWMRWRLDWQGSLSGDFRRKVLMYPRNSW